ncbi:DEAD/DEAH box helicase [Sulfurospirillum halorespirans]|uniref:ATP-dependent RNA helicase RhlE n=1 Tax=Sulfurospirillum halorespirans DSM 13726 TaxID=1193502 RepID=A0A1D7TL21_9BACT|nr:DEAD/DEAH box helicase [Sulfurospirillum halorespirans]AOO65699.1 ATP-dependent RNA helicase RhlE [Sulfurospirillum halorespirans DSM 13726]
MLFEKLGLIVPLQEAVTELGYTKPTPVQNKVIPLVLEGKDVMATAQTGTGKTAAYALPLLQILAKKTQKSTTKKVVRALILVPTRELASQVNLNVQEYGKNLELTIGAIYGGVKFTPQVKKLEKGIDVLIATPGRLLEHIKLDNVDLSRVEMLVFDEADRILDMGFWDEVETLLSLLPKKRQTLLFSVGVSKSVKRLSEVSLKKPITVAINNQGEFAKNVQQTIYVVDKERKCEMLSFMIGTENWHQVLVFTKTKQSADEVGDYLSKSGLKTLVLHGDKAHSQRTKAVAAFKENSIRVLVATDIASRGLDIEDLPHVINYELPGDAEDYLHRAGRTGRAGKEGRAISFVSQEEKLKLKEIEKILKYTLKTEFYPGFETQVWVEKEAKKHTIQAKIDREKANKKPMGLRKKREEIKANKAKKTAKTCGIGAKNCKVK